MSVNIRRIAKRAKRLLQPGETISQQAIRGGVWVGALRIVDRVFGLIRMIVLARLLAPHDFGLMGIVLLAMSALERFSFTGFSTALVQKKGNIEEFLDTAWTTELIRGIVLCGVLFVSAPMVATFFNVPEIIAIIHVVAFTELIKGFTNIGVVYFRKELEFNKQFVYTLSGTVADVVVAISAALILRSVWALVFGLLAGSLMRCGMSYIIHPYKPKIEINWEKFKELFKYGKWVLGYMVVILLATQGDSAFLGKVLGITALGFYQMAYRISAFAKTEIAASISMVTFPSLSKLQENIPKLQEGFLRSLEVTTCISLLICGGILLLGSDFTRIFLGEKWMPMVQALRIMAVGGFVGAIVRIIDPLFGAAGRPDLTFWMYLSQFGVMAAVIFPLTMNFGLLGTAMAVLIGVSVTIPIWWYKAAKIIEVTNYKLLKQIIPSLTGVFVMSAFIMPIRQLLGKIGIGWFFCLVLVGIISYFSVLIFFWKRFHCGPLRNFQMVKQSLVS